LAAAFFSGAFFAGAFFSGAFFAAAFFLAGAFFGSGGCSGRVNPSALAFRRTWSAYGSSSEEEWLFTA
jgi:hypothetical protein